MKDIVLTKENKSETLDWLYYEKRKRQYEHVKILIDGENIPLSELTDEQLNSKLIYLEK